VCKPGGVGRKEWKFSPEDLDTIAQVIGSRLFTSIRGAKRGGSAPTTLVARLLKRDRETIVEASRRADKISGPLPSNCGSATPFDRAMAKSYNWSANGGKAGFEAGMQIMDAFVHLETRDVAVAVRAMLRQTVVDALSDENLFLTQLTVQAAAMEHLKHRVGGPYPLDADGVEERERTSSWAEWLLSLRREEWKATTNNYVWLLGIALRLLARRPKPGATLHDIVVSMQSLWAGAIFRCYLDPEAISSYVDPAGPPEEGPIERAMWDLVMGMTEDGVFTPTIDWDGTERVLVEIALEILHQEEGMPGRTASVDEVVKEAVRRGVTVDLTIARALFADDAALAARCFDYLMGSWESEVKDSDFARSFALAAFPAAEALLIWLSEVRGRYPCLLDAFGFDQSNAAYDELTDFLAIVLSTDPPDATLGPSWRRRARKYIDLAATGGAWEDELARFETRHVSPRPGQRDMSDR
jgi:hypothetical protein